MSLITDREDMERVVREAEAIGQGADPRTVAGDGGPTSSASEMGGEEPRPTGSPSPASFEELAGLGLLVLDSGFFLFFGPGSEIPEPLRGEAKQQLMALCAKYLPMASSVGPELALLGIVAIHGFNCSQARWRTTAPSPASSASGEAANQP